jgi:nucleoid DNA-binding protein
MVTKKNKRNNLKKEDIVKSIHSHVGTSSFYMAQIVSDIIHLLISNLSLNKKLKIKNFGTFTLQKKKERTGRNPKNNVKYNISERITATFKASNNLSIRINKNV